MNKYETSVLCAIHMQSTLWFCVTESRILTAHLQLHDNKFQTLRVLSNPIFSVLIKVFVIFWFPKILLGNCASFCHVFLSHQQSHCQNRRGHVRRMARHLLLLTLSLWLSCCSSYKYETYFFKQKVSILKVVFLVDIMGKVVLDLLRYFSVTSMFPGVCQLKMFAYM